MIKKLVYHVGAFLAAIIVSSTVSLIIAISSLSMKWVLKKLLTEFSDDFIDLSVLGVMLMVFVIWAIFADGVQDYLSKKK